jgi:hypothetical protein
MALTSSFPASPGSTEPRHTDRLMVPSEPKPAVR